MANGLEANFVEAVMAQYRSGKRVTLAMNSGDAWAVLSVLLFAIHQPEMSPNTRGVVEPIALWLIAQLATTDVLREGVRRALGGELVLTK